MATAAGCTLGQVASIEYPKSEWDYISRRRNALPQATIVSFELDNDSFDFTPESIEVQENVTIQWYLEQQYENILQSNRHHRRNRDEYLRINRSCLAH